MSERGAVPIFVKGGTTWRMGGAETPLRTVDGPPTLEVLPGLSYGLISVYLIGLSIGLSVCPSIILICLKFFLENCIFEEIDLQRFLQFVFKKENCLKSQQQKNI